MGHTSAETTRVGGSGVKGINCPNRDWPSGIGNV